MSKYILQAPNCWHQFQTQQLHATGRQPRLPEPKGLDNSKGTNTGDDGRVKPGEEMWA
jgi:hypothetical protein